MVIAHTGIKIAAAKQAEVVAWYETVLATLGYTKTASFVDGAVVGFSDGGPDHPCDWWVSAVPEGKEPIPSHHAFVTNGMCPNVHPLLFGEKSPAETFVTYV